MNFCKEDFFELAKTGIPEEVKRAVESGADLNARDRYGLTPLMLVAENNTISEVIQVLLNAGADGKAKNISSITAFDYVVVGGKTNKSKTPKFTGF